MGVVELPILAVGLSMDAFAVSVSNGLCYQGYGRRQAVFAALTLRGGVSQEFMLVYTTVIAFYFGTQTQKISDAVEEARP